MMSIVAMPAKYKYPHYSTLTKHSGMVQKQKKKYISREEPIAQQS